MGLYMLAVIVVLVGGPVVYAGFIHPRRWMKRFGSGNYHGDRMALTYFTRQYQNNRLLESYGENPTGRDNQ